MGAWAEVQCHFRCEGCQRRSPLNHLDFDGEAECLRCGETGPLDPGQWLDAIDHVRAQAARPGEKPATFGSDQLISGRITQKTLVVRARRADPCCGGCEAPLELVRCAAGMVVMKCAACDHTTKYAMPRGVRASKPELSGVIAAAHARGANEATVTQDAQGVQTIACPECAGPVDHSPAAIVVRCRFCKLSLRVPYRGLASEGDLEPEVWWLYFKDA